MDIVGRGGECYCVYSEEVGLGHRGRLRARCVSVSKHSGHRVSISAELLEQRP